MSHGQAALLDAGAPVPAGLEHQAFVATPLTTADLALDYAAYMASPDVIRMHSDGRWPTDGFTLDQDRDQIRAHEIDHEARRAFTFLLLSPTRTDALGCLYLNPLRGYLSGVGADPQTLSTHSHAAAMVTFWIRQDLQETGLADLVADNVNTWLITEWPLQTHLFRILPGETSSLAALERLPLRRVRWQLPGERRPYLWYQPT